jgi:hypothetical protein
MVKGLSRQMNQSRVVRLGKNKQMLTIPQHCESLKLQRLFRLNTTIPTGETSLLVTLEDIRNAVRRELQVNTTIFGESFAIHDVRVYMQTPLSTGASSFGSLQLGVSVIDVEEVPGSGSANVVDQFNDFASASGIAHVHFRYPVNNRPTFNTGTPSVTLLALQVSSTPAANVPVIVDFTCDYTRAALSPFNTLALTAGGLPSPLDHPI